MLSEKSFMGAVENMRHRRASVIFVLITMFIDVLGMGLVIPILPRLVQNLLGDDVAEASFVFGLLVSVYAVMQFLCAPVLGALSDRFGRRPVILLALLGLGFDYVLLSLAPSIWWLVLGRIVAGIFGATFTPAGAYIADVSPPEKRAANFGLMGIAFGLGFIAGPALGGLLGEANLRLPFIVCAGLTFANFLFGLLVMPESLRPENRRAINISQMNPIGALRAVWRYRGVAAMVPVFVAAQLAQQGLQSVWVPYTTYRYGWGVAGVGVSLAIVGLLFAVSQGAVVRPMVKRFGEKSTLLVSLVVASVGMLLFGLATEGWMMYAVTALYCLGLGLLNPTAQALMSQAVPPNEQGLLQGAMTSVMTAAAIVGPPVANGSFALFISPQSPLALPGAPFFLGSVLCLAALVCAWRSSTHTGSQATTPRESLAGVVAS
ncbi:MAG TPA: TCR/Tet family MFS transporter [Chloroflexota bacterium]|nr:TCR/Tet family MFS transporter [Chloroflexota bacterium]